MKLKCSQALFALFVALISTSCQDLLKHSSYIKENDRGLELMNQGDYDGATEAFKAALQSTLMPKLDRFVILGNLSNAYEMLDEYDSCRMYAYQSAMLYDTNRFEHYKGMAEVHLMDEDVGSALRLLKKAEAVSSEDLQVINLLGLVYLGGYDEEHEDLDLALEYNTRAYEMANDRITKEVLAQTYWYREEYDNAEKFYSELYADHPQMVDYLYSLGSIKNETGHEDEAEKIFNKVLQRDSSYKFWIDLQTDAIDFGEDLDE
jgi:tetratricopeptide (TPR) repeat protein